MVESITNKKALDFLLVGTDEQFLKATEEALSKDSHPSIKIVNSARYARELLYEFDVAFVICEISIPHMNGTELLRLIRRSPQLFDTPVILVTYSDNAEVIKFAKEELADDVLIKPIQAVILKEAIKSVLDSRKNLSNEEKTLTECRKLFLDRKYEDAISLALDSMGPEENEELLYIVSHCYYRMKKYRKASIHLKKLMKKTSVKAMHLLGKICMAENQCGDAIVHLNKAHNQNPSNLDLKIDVAKLHLAMGMEDEANKQFASMLESELSDLNLIKIGKAYLKKGKLKKAGIFFNRVKSPIPETAYIFAQYGNSLETKEMYEDALIQYKHSVELAPKNIHYLLSLAKVYLKLGNNQNATIVVNNILKLDPDHNQAKKILAFINK